MTTSNNNNKKWIIGGSITLLLIFGAAMGTGAIISATTKPADDYIRIYAGDEIFMEEEIDLGDDKTTNEQKAKMLEAQFYSAALFGTVNREDVSTPSSSTYILQEGNDWNLPFISTGDSAIANEDLRTEFLKVKFLNDTQNSSVLTYLDGLYNTAQGDSKLEIQHAMDELIGEVISSNPDTATEADAYEVTGLELISNEDYSTSKGMIFEAIKNDDSYLKDALKDMMTFAYLWQEPTQSAYDYIFTRELVYNAPSLVSTMVVDGEAADEAADEEGGAEYKAFESNTTASGAEAEGWNTTYEKFKENGILVDNSTADDQLSLGDVEGFKGFKGVQFGTSAGTNLKSDYLNWSNTWLYNDESEETITSNGGYTNSDILTTGNYYIANTNGGADGEGAVIFDTATDSTDPVPGADEGNRTIYVYNQLYPFTFREPKDKIYSVEGESIYTLGNEEFSLFADGDAAGYTPAADIATAKNYLFDLWFGDYSVQGEVYIAEALMTHDTSITTKALNYWNDQGFYIELSGSYEKDLLEYIPDSIIMDEE